MSERYDLVVIGGGSGGLACSKQAAELGKRVAVLDYVDPSHQGTSWGLGGAAVNVGCIPKKLMHHAASIGQNLSEAGSYGWENDISKEYRRAYPKHDWRTLRANITNYIRSLNSHHRHSLQDKKVEYFNAKGSLVDKNTVKALDRHQNEILLKTDNVVIATGMRPKLLHQVPGMTECAISSDDLFWLEKAPGKTLLIGGSYVAFEPAGFLTGLGYDTTVMLRSIPFRRFDKQMATLLLDHVKSSGTKIIQGESPSRLTRQSNGRILVEWESGSDVFDTVLLAVGREAQTHNMGLESLGVELHQETHKIIGGYGGDTEQSSVEGVFAIGDILHGRPELTPVSIKAGQLLARRIFRNEKVFMDYEAAPITVFTPLQYSTVGLSEEMAVDKHGVDRIEVYHTQYRPLEFVLPGISNDQCYIKVICMREAPQKVIGIHLIGPNSGELMQGFAVALRCGLTMERLQSTVGIHPTVAEELVKIHITKRSGLDPSVAGCAC